MLTPQQFAKEAGLSYSQVLQMCKTKDINALETGGGHFKIPPKELDKFKSSDYVSKEEYLKVIRENERLKVILNQCKSYISTLDI